MKGKQMGESVSCTSNDVPMVMIVAAHMLRKRPNVDPAERSSSGVSASPASSKQLQAPASNGWTFIGALRFSALRRPRPFSPRRALRCVRPPAPLLPHRPPSPPAWIPVRLQAHPGDHLPHKHRGHLLHRDQSHLRQHPAGLEDLAEQVLLCLPLFPIQARQIIQCCTC